MITTRDKRSKEPHSIVRPQTTEPSKAFKVMPVQALEGSAVVAAKAMIAIEVRMCLIFIIGFFQGLLS